MSAVILPEREQLVKDLVEMLMVLNEQGRRQERWQKGIRARAWVPQEQLEERARNIAMMLVTLPAAASVRLG